MRISDWSSDVCSSDLQRVECPRRSVEVEVEIFPGGRHAKTVALAQAPERIGIVAERNREEDAVQHTGGLPPGGPAVDVSGAVVGAAGRQLPVALAEALGNTVHPGECDRQPDAALEDGG